MLHSLHSFLVDQVYGGNVLFAFLIAILAGTISFFSPCVLPLVPGYLSYAAGMSDMRKKSRIALGALLFVLGFTVLFMSYGAAFGSLGSHIDNQSRLLQIIMGSLTILMGVAFMANQTFYRSFKINWKMEAGLWGAPVLGFMFGLGWTPCIGPTLAAVEALSFQSSSATRGAVLSFAYCLGLGIPFFLVGLFFDQSKSLRRFISKRGNIITIIGGTFLILIGLAQVTGVWLSIINHFRDSISGFIPVL